MPFQFARKRAFLKWHFADLLILFHILVYDIDNIVQFIFALSYTVHMLLYSRNFFLYH